MEVATKAISFGYREKIPIEKEEVKIHIPMTIGCGELRTIINVLAGAAWQSTLARYGFLYVPVIWM